jgi:hypothetical protein
MLFKYIFINYFHAFIMSPYLELLGAWLYYVLLMVLDWI